MTSLTRVCPNFQKAFQPSIRTFASKPEMNCFLPKDEFGAELKSLKGRVEALEKKQFDNAEIELKKLATEKEIEFKKIEAKGANLATVLIVAMGSGFAFFMATR